MVLWSCYDENYTVIQEWRVPMFNENFILRYMYSGCVAICFQ